MRWMEPRCISLGQRNVMTDKDILGIGIHIAAQVEDIGEAKRRLKSKVGEVPGICNRNITFIDGRRGSQDSRRCSSRMLRTGTRRAGTRRHLTRLPVWEPRHWRRTLPDTVRSVLRSIPTRPDIKPGSCRLPVEALRFVRDGLLNHAWTEGTDGTMPTSIPLPGFVHDLL